MTRATATRAPTSTSPACTGGSACIDGNEAVARVAYALSEVVAIYPITPASSMGELADEWAAAGRPNLWGDVPVIVEMQSEAGAAGALHGGVQRGALATTFTASQGLLLMLPDMFKVAGELTPAVIHVAARAVATHALSIFGDHSDVMAVRSSGFTMLASSSVQEAHDLALVAHAASLRTRLPVLHFFDGFRTSHEVNRIDVLDDADIRALVDESAIAAHRARALSPEHPVVRGTAQNPDVFFQAREAANPFHDGVPDVVADLLRRLGDRTGRRYGLVDYTGHPQAERVLVVMGSGAGAAAEAVDALVARGERVGLVTIRLFRPFPAQALVDALPPTVRGVAVLDRTKEPGATGEPLYQDVVVALAERAAGMPLVVGARYGLASKEFTPAMAAAVLDELHASPPRRHVTVGIVDDVTHLSVRPDPSFRIPSTATGAVAIGLGSDGTVGAARRALQLVGDLTGRHVQSYAVYDSKKSGAMTVSHLRWGDAPIRSTYLVDEADLVACTQLHLLERVDVLARARRGATLLLNSPHGDATWAHLPALARRRIVERALRVWVVDAGRIARECGIAGHVSAVVVPCLFDLAGVLERDALVRSLEEGVVEEYGKRGGTVVDRNVAATRRAFETLVPLAVPDDPGTAETPTALVPDDAPGFVRRVTARLLAGEGDLLPVSALPPDGTFPTGTARFEKRGLAVELPAWKPDLCIDCGLCAAACPHAAIRMNVHEPAARDDLACRLLAKSFRSRELPGHDLTIQVAPDDCTGCGVCVDVCPARDKTDGRKALAMVPAAPVLDRERARWDAFTRLPAVPRDALAPDTVKGAQVREPLFEFSGACAGCGETPYLKLVTQLFGDRMVVANATGCSSIYGGNLPTTPWARDAAGRGPAWANSLFEDNAEFGLGMRLALDHQRDAACRLLARLRPAIGDDVVDRLLSGVDARDDAGVAAQRSLVGDLRLRLEGLNGDPAVARLRDLADALVHQSVWIVGGDGWAYDIGSAGLDHVLASGRDVNVLVLDTEVYSNTGGQASKATPRGAVAKFAAAGKRTGKKDLGLIASAYGDVYVAHVAIGANALQTTKALLEAAAWPGPSLVIAYSTCIAHGIDMATSMSHQRDAVRSGHWPLFRYRPGHEAHERPFHLDSKAPSVPIREFALAEGRFALLANHDPARADAFLAQVQADVDERWRLYEQLAGVERTQPPHDDPTTHVHDEGKDR